MPDTQHDQRHQRDGAILAKHVDQDLQHGLLVGRADGRGQVALDGEQQAQQQEEAEDGRAPDGRQHADRRAPGRVARLLGQVGRCVEAGDGVLRQQDAADGDVGRGGADGPAFGAVQARAVVEALEDLRGGLVGGRGGDDGDGEAADAEAVEDDGAVVEVLEQVHAETIEEAVADEDGDVYAERLACRGFVVVLHRGSGRD